MGKTFARLMQVRDTKGGGFFLLLDPDRVPREQYIPLAEAALETGVDAILVGTSFTLESNFARGVREIKEAASVPVIIFPGSFAQVSPEADAILFTSLLSGRNPEYLIEEQMKGAPLIRQCNLETIPTGYLLIESGTLTSVQYISSSLPIPRSKHDLACAHALAAQYLGMQLVYLEAGSGANGAVPVAMVQAVADYIDIPVMVGGGLRTPEAIAERLALGASFVVVGTHFELEPDLERLKDMAAAAHPKQSVRI